MEEFKTFINDCWAKHETESEFVAKKLEDSQNVVTNENELASYVGIVVHTLGGHLGEWQRGIDLLESLKELKLENKDPIIRGQAILALGMNDCKNKYLDMVTDDQMASVYSHAATELLNQDQNQKAKTFLDKALSLVPNDLDNTNSLAKSLAISTNNMACALEEKNELSLEDSELMILCATTARKYWEVAGSWVEVERAEYRLAMSHLKAKNFDKAYMHATQCLEICTKNKADEFELFFAHEVLVKVNRALCEMYKSKVKPEWQNYCVIP